MTTTRTVHDLGNNKKCYTWPNCSIHNAKPITLSGLTVDFNKRVDALNSDVIPAVPAIQKQTPADIDDVLANLYYQQSRMYGRIHELKLSNDRYQRYLDEGRQNHQADDFRRWIAKNDEEIAGLRQQISDIRAEMKPGEDEFNRRGRWTRAFLVTNGNGHVHSSMGCSTCRSTTTYRWLTDYSGKDEAQVVDDAGERACTVCYASAPVETFSRPSRIEDPEQKAKRIAREKAKAQRDAIKLAKGITNPDGSELVFKIWSNSNGQVIASEVTAEREAVGILVDREYTARYAQPGSMAARESEKQFHQEQLEILLAALAHKRGQTTDEVLSTVEDKAAKKIRRENR